jgi:hypothetical protein
MAGYCFFGGTPTVLDPRGSGRAATDLTNVHEQTHRDLVNNTLYGYVLRRLRDLQQLQEQNHTKIAHVDRLIANLSGKVFLCAEGSATAMEMLVAGNRAEGEADALLAALPPDYQTATTLYLKLVKTHLPFPPAVDFLLRASLIAAVTELALDWPIFAATPPDDYWQLAQFFFDHRPPDERLPSMIQAAEDIPSRAYQFILMSNRDLLETDLMGRGARALARDLKMGLVAASEGAPPQPSPLFEDATRLALNAGIDQNLYPAFPGLKHLEWDTTKIFGAVVAVETKEPEFLLAEEQVDPPALLARMQEMACSEGFVRFVVQFFRDPKGSSYSVIASPTKMRGQALDTAEPYLVSRSVPPDRLHAIDRSGVPLTWLVWGLQILIGGGFHDSQFVASLESAVAVRLQEFNWEAAVLAAKAFPGERAFLFYDVAGLEGIAAAAIETGSRTVFGLTPASYPNDPAFSKIPERRDIVTNPEFSPALLVAIRTSRSDTV